MAYVIKADIPDPHADGFVFESQKTMYGGKHIAVGDLVFVFASETHGGRGLVARGRVVSSTPVPKPEGVGRFTPRVSVVVRRTGSAVRALGRAELRRFDQWNDGRPETELNFKFYRQATDKIGGISPAATDFLETFFDPGSGPVT